MECIGTINKVIACSFIRRLSPAPVHKSCAICDVATAVFVQCKCVSNGVSNILWVFVSPAIHDGVCMHAYMYCSWKTLLWFCLITCVLLAVIAMILSWQGR